jgi:hypothetical protein
MLRVNRGYSKYKRTANNNTSLWSDFVVLSRDSIRAANQGTDLEQAYNAVDPGSRERLERES